MCLIFLGWALKAAGDTMRLYLHDFDTRRNSKKPNDTLKNPHFASKRRWKWYFGNGTKKAIIAASALQRQA